MPVSAAQLFSWHEGPGAFKALSPPWNPVVLAHAPQSLKEGELAVILIPLLAPLLGKRASRLPKVFPFWLPWVARHHGYVAGVQFEDTQIFGPFAQWHHLHACVGVDEQTSLLEDQITYTLPLSPWFDWLLHTFIEQDLRRLFAYRHQITLEQVGQTKNGLLGT